jgi:dTDP-4-dehydrorhamnose 3,5-epimerase
MEIKETSLSGVKVIINDLHKDERGIFCKTFNKKIFKDIGLTFEIKESFYSISSKNVIRGMHFQLPPHDHDKIVFVPKGKILDVVLDLRKKSKTFGQYFSIELSEDNKNSIYIPKGFAHGFKTLINNSLTIYFTSTVHELKYDSGIRWDSFGMDWKVENPIISKKDNNLKKYYEFESPF